MEDSAFNQEDHYQQLLLDDDEEERAHAQALISMACSSCYEPYDLDRCTPYLLSCGHTACKQCLRTSHKSKTPYICSIDSIVVPTQVIKTLTKNLDVIQTLRERRAAEMSRFQDINGSSGQVKEVTTQGAGKEEERQSQQYIDVSKAAAEYKKKAEENKDRSPQQLKISMKSSENENGFAQKVAKSYFPFEDEDDQDQHKTYRPPSMAQRKSIASNTLSSAGATNMLDSVNTGATVGSAQPISERNSQKNNNNAPPHIPLKDITEEQIEASMASSFNAGSRKKKKKAKKKKKKILNSSTMQDVSVYEYESVMSKSIANLSVNEGGGGTERSKPDLPQTPLAEEILAQQRRFQSEVERDDEGGGESPPFYDFPTSPQRNQMNSTLGGFSHNHGTYSGALKEYESNFHQAAEKAMPPSAHLIEDQSFGANAEEAIATVTKQLTPDLSRPINNSELPKIQDQEEDKNFLRDSLEPKEQSGIITNKDVGLPTFLKQVPKDTKQINQINQQSNVKPPQNEQSQAFHSPVMQKYSTPKNSQVTQLGERRPSTSQVRYPVPFNKRNSQEEMKINQALPAQNNQERFLSQQTGTVKTEQMRTRPTSEIGMNESTTGASNIIINPSYEESEPPSKRDPIIHNQMTHFNDQSIHKRNQSLPPRPPNSNNSPQNRQKAFNLSDQSINMSINNINQNLILHQDDQTLQPLSEACHLHPNEVVKYFCRSPDCMKGLCWVCILDHSRHDFVAANDMAALEIKSIVRQAQRLCKKQDKQLKEIRSLTEAKLQYIENKRNEEYGKLGQWFAQLKRTLDEREIYLRASFNVEIHEIETRLTADMLSIQGQHEEYVNLFKGLKTLTEQFSISSDVGVVSNANLAWDLSKKTHDHVNLVVQKEKSLYVVQRVMNDSYQESMEIEQNPDIKIPRFDIELEKERQKVLVMGQLIRHGSEYRHPSDLANQLYENPLFQVPEYYHSQYEAQQQQQDLQPYFQQQNTLPPLEGQQQQHQYTQDMLPMLENELQMLLNQTSQDSNHQLYTRRQQDHREETGIIGQPDMKTQNSLQGQKPGEEITIRIVPNANSNQLYPQDIHQQTYQIPQESATQDLYNYGKSYSSQFAPIIEEPDEATPNDGDSILSKQVADIGIQNSQSPQKIQLSLENKQIQTKKRRYNEAKVQCEVESRTVTTQTKIKDGKFPLSQSQGFLPPIAQRQATLAKKPDLRTMSTQTPQAQVIDATLHPPTKIAAQQTDIKKPEIRNTASQTKTIGVKERQIQTTEVLLTERIVYRIPPKVEMAEVECQTSEKRGQDISTQNSIKKSTKDAEIQISVGESKQVVTQTTVRGNEHAEVQTSNRVGQTIVTQTSLKVIEKQATVSRNEVGLSPMTGGSSRNVQTLPPQIPRGQLEKKQSELVRGSTIVRQSTQIQPEEVRLQTVPPIKNLHWFRWDTSEIYRMNPETKEWRFREDIKVQQNFLFFSSILHLPNDQGCFLMGGQDNEDNYSKRVQFFCKYNVFIEKPPMINRRAFFPSVFIKLENSIYVLGGSDSNTSDLTLCEKFSLMESLWRPIAPLQTAKNGSSAVAFENYRLIFLFGGNSHRSASSLNHIEKYQIDFDKWSTIDIKMKRALHDLQALQVTRDRVLIFGGHTDGGAGPNKEVLLVDLSLECLRSRNKPFLELSDQSEGGKIYFPPVLEQSGKLQLIFGYCDETPRMEEIDISEFLGYSKKSERVLGSGLEEDYEEHSRGMKPEKQHSNQVNALLERRAARGGSQKVVPSLNLH